MNTLTIKDLKIYAYHGCLDSEKELGQFFLISAIISWEMFPENLDDNLQSTLCYKDLAWDLHKWSTEHKYDLIETLAYQLVVNIFQHYPQAQKVTIEVRKPQAPIGLPLEYASIKLTRQKRRVFLSLGSNIGERHQYLQQACQEMGKHHLSIRKMSKVIETAPWGNPHQDFFLNQVIEISTFHTPQELMKILLRIEEKMGRKREVKWGPRIIDLDILFIDQEIIVEDGLIVPHPHLAQRAFVLEPLEEIAPDLIHPVMRKSIHQLLEELKEKK